MVRIVGALALLLALSGAEAQGQTIRVQWDREVDFSRYQSFAWLEGTAAVDPEVDRMIVESVENELSVDLKATVDDKKTVTVGDTTMLDFTAHFSDSDGMFFLRGRVAYRAGTLYQVLAMGPGQVPTSSAELFASTFALK